jgi:hypothetical protein
MRTKDSRINKDFVLSNVANTPIDSQIAIFEKYLGISNVRYLIENNILFCNPLREDSFPTCSFKILSSVNYGYKVWFRDWAEISGKDCFDLVQNMAKCDFNEALELICYHFDLLSLERTTQLKYVMTPTTILELNQKEAKPIEIRIKTIPWGKEHLAFWMQFELCTPEDLANIVPIRNYWVNGVKFNIPKNIGFAYLFGGYDYKIYLPYADKAKGELKFIHNRADIIQGAGEVDFAKSTLFITSSYKDVKVLNKIAKTYDFDFTALAPQAETILIPKEKIAKIKEKFEYVILFHNNDKAGIQAAISQSETYDCLFIHNPIDEPKDPSDMVKLKGLKYTADTIKTLLYHVIPPF